MAFLENTSQPFISSKRQLDDVDDRELDKFIKRKTAMRKYPPPKIRIGVQAVRDFPPGCGFLQDSTEIKADTKPSKKLEIEKSQPFEDNKLKSYKPKELGFNKPTSKVKFWDPTKQVVRDFPPISGIKDERKPLKNLNSVDSKLGFNKARDPTEQVVRDFPPVSVIKEERKPLKNINPVDSKLGFNKPSVSRPPSKVKYYDSTSANDDNTLEPKPTNTIASQREQMRREKIREAMVLFDDVYTQLSKENQSKQKGEKMGPCKVPMEASRMVKQKLKWMNADKALGQIRGVQPGDIFKFRSQLHLIGLHCQPHCGIDYTKINGKNLAISIVDSHRYSNESQACNELTYCGEGGHGVSGWGRKNVEHDDQKLERGNLALKNSMSEKNPVRVIRKVFGFGKKGNDVFVYDGLYTVNQCTQKRSDEGKMVFMFQLVKMDGQSNVQRMVNAMSGDVGFHKHSTFQML